jgi:hypothetical protein
VEAFTDFKPTDGKEWTNPEPQLPPDFKLKDLVNKLTFEKMSESSSFLYFGISNRLKSFPLSIDDGQASTLCEAIYDQILYGYFTLSSFTNEARDTFVEYGFARHKPGTNHTVIDEPLAILAALQWLYHSNTFSMFKCLSHDIHKHQKRKNGFEAYLVFYMRTVFETTPELDAVFTFRDDFARRGKTDLAWQHENFELVTVVHADRSNPHISVVTPSCGPAPKVGFLAKSGKEVLEWISTNSDRSTFCFPPEAFGPGPDLLFFIRSKVSGKLLLVMIQAKKHDSVEKQILIEGVRTITPSWFWKSKDMKVRSCL